MGVESIVLVFALVLLLLLALLILLGWIRVLALFNSAVEIFPFGGCRCFDVVAHSSM
jgi:hypothetical protein